MGRRKQGALDDLDELLIATQRIRANTDKSSAALPCIPRSKRVMEFAQFHGAIKYREFRQLISALTQSRKVEAEFCRIATERLPFKPDNWTLFAIEARTDSVIPWLIPETLEPGRGLISRPEELQSLLKQDEEVQHAYDAFKECFKAATRLADGPSNWIREQFKNGSLESKIIAFKDKASKKTRISKTLISNFVDPTQAQAVREEGELPALSVGEREAMQFLLWKIDSMSKTELHIRDTWILDGKEERPKENGYVVVFERTEALKKNYGNNIGSDGWRFKSLEVSLTSLLEKKRKLVLIKSGERMEISKTLVNHLEMRHEFTNEPGLKDYIAVWIPYDVAHLDKLYTSYPSDHIALIRNTPPETRITDSEICFFDILWQEAPHDRSKPKTVQRKKPGLVDCVGGPEAKDHDHQGRIAGRIEALFAPKAINMGILKRFDIYTNADGEEVYEWEYSDEDTLNRLLNRGQTPQITNLKESANV